MYHPQALLGGDVDKSLLDAAGASPLYGRQLRLQERQSSDENDEGLLVGRPVAPRPNKYVGLDLT